MCTLEIADAEVMQMAIRQEIDRSEESRYDHRLHGVLLVASGRSCTAVSQLFGEDATPVQRWGATVRAPRLCRVARRGVPRGASVPEDLQPDGTLPAQAPAASGTSEPPGRCRV
jgi:hypothetical protein